MYDFVYDKVPTAIPSDTATSIAGAISAHIGQAVNDDISATIPLDAAVSRLALFRRCGG